jgi:hypothetical protein
MTVNEAASQAFYYQRAYLVGNYEYAILARLVNCEEIKQPKTIGCECAKTGEASLFLLIPVILPVVYHTQPEERR